MITDVKLVKYFRNSDKSESEISSVSIYSDLVDNDYELNYQFELGDEFTFTGSNINMEFFVSDTLRETIIKQDIDDGYFYGIEIYLDNNTTPEFWGYIDLRTIEYNHDQDTYSFTAVDWTTYYFDIFRTYTAGTDFIVGSLDIDALLLAWTYNTLIENVNVDVGLMNKQVNFKTWLNAKYTLADYLREVQKHYGAYIYIDADKTLNMINRTRTSNDTKYIGDSIMNILESGYEPKSYKAVAISYFFVNLAFDPDLNSLSGGGFGDSDVLILSDGQGWIIPMPYENGVSIDDFDRALLGTFPNHRFNYLDLRQRMPTRGAADPFIMLTYNPIAIETVANRYNAYRNILKDTLILNVEVNRYDFNLLDKINQNAYPNPFGDEIYYQAIGIKKYLKSERSILTLREIV